MNRHEFDHLEQAIRSLKSIQPDMTHASRSRLARKCAAEMASSRMGFWTRIQGFLSYQLPQRAMASALGVLLLVGLTAVLLPRKPADHLPGAPDRTPVQLVSLQPDASGRITLEWRDGTDRTYRVLKSNNPKDFTSAIRYSVRGNRWVDQSPAVGQVTYYRVE